MIIYKNLILVIALILGLAFTLSLTSFGRRRSMSLGLALTSLIGGFYVLIVVILKAAEFSRLDLRLYGEDPFELALPASLALSFSLLTSIISITRIISGESRSRASRV